MSKINKTFCNFPTSGLFVSHRKSALCCVARKVPQTSFTKFWYSDYRKESLDKMNQGLPVKECEDCYRQESLGNFSGRTTYKNEVFEIKKNPTRLDLDLSNFCNLKCIMCNPDRSSQWAKELGMYTESNGVSTITEQQLQDLFDISTEDLEHIVIQGGEPSIMPEFDRYFQYLEEKNYISNIEVHTISNLTNLNKKFFKFLSKFRKVKLSVSIDAYGLANDYIRFPSDFDTIEKNVIELSKIPGNIDVEILSSLQLLSLYNFDKMLSWYNKIQKIFGNSNRVLNIVPMKVTSPEIYNIYNAPPTLRKKFKNDISNWQEFDHEDKNFLKTGLQIISKIQEKTPYDSKLIDQLKSEVIKLDTRRNIKITDYIPNFYNFLQ